MGISVTREGALLHVTRDGTWSCDDTLPIPTITHVSFDPLRWNRPVRVGPLEYGFGGEEGGADAARRFYSDVRASIQGYYVHGVVGG